MPVRFKILIFWRTFFILLAGDEEEEEGEDWKGVCG
jgi:hypothetical protein